MSEGSRLDGRRNLADRRPDVRILAAALDVRGRSGGKAFSGDQPNAETVVRRFEGERVRAARDIQVPQGPQLGVVRSLEFRLQLGAEPDAHAIIVAVLRRGGNGGEHGGGAGGQQEFH